MDKQRDYFFNLKRFLNLFKLDLYCAYRNLIIILLATTGFSALINFITFNEAHQFDVHSIFYVTFTVFLGGFIFTSLSFSDVHKKGSDLQYLLIPASFFEKFLSKLGLSTVVYLLASVTVYFILSTFAEGLSLLLFNKSHSVFNPFTIQNLKTWGLYFILQAVFLFGSIFFKKMAFAKTALAILISLMLFSIFFSIVFLLTNADLFLNEGFLVFTKMNELADSYGIFFEIAGQIIEIAFYICFAPFFWLLTCLRLREEEV